MNSEQPYILSGHNLWELMAKEVRRTEEKEKTKTITDILKQPDTNEEVNMGRALTSLSKGLENAFGVGLSGICGGDSVILFKLSANLPGESAPSSTARDLEWGVNCIKGAFVTGDKINYFEIAQTSGDDIVVVELHPFGEGALNLSQELGKFIASREDAHS